MQSPLVICNLFDSCYATKLIIYHSIGMYNVKHKIADLNYYLYICRVISHSKNMDVHYLSGTLHTVLTSLLLVVVMNRPIVPVFSGLPQWHWYSHNCPTVIQLPHTAINTETNDGKFYWNSCKKFFLPMLLSSVTHLHYALYQLKWKYLSQSKESAMRLWGRLVQNTVGTKLIDWEENASGAQAFLEKCAGSKMSYFLWKRTERLDTQEVTTVNLLRN